MKKISNKLIRCVLKFALAVCCIGVSGMTFCVQAQENSRGIEQTADLKFLAVCDENDFKGTTVTDAQAVELQKKVDELTKGLKTDYEKAKSIFYWVNTNVRYPEKDENVQPAVTAYDVYKQRVAVCGGFSNLYNELLHLAEIPSVAVAGYYLGYEDPAAHQWNAVYADGRWFYADTTGAGFDAPGLLETHQVVEVYDAVLETEDLLIGYYNGVAVIGTQQVMNEVTVPDTYGDMKITSISYQLFNKEYGVEVLNIGVHVNNIEKTTLVSAEGIKEINVAKENNTYASKDGILYTKDMKELLVYPKAREVKKYILPKETTVLDVKDAFGNLHLCIIEVEDGNSAFSSYDGALYDGDQKELKFVPPGKASVIIPENAGISDMAFANVDRDNFVIYGTPGSYAETFAGWYNITFKNVKDYENPEEPDAPEVPTVNKETLKAAIAEADEKVKETYTEESWAAFETALAEAKAVVVKEDATQEEVDAMAAAIEEAVAKLVEKPAEPDVPEEPGTPESPQLTGVTRLAGDGRYATSLAIADEYKKVLGVEKFTSAVIATGADFGDALPGSYLAYLKEAPIILVNGDRAKYNDPAIVYLKKNVEAGKTVYILGGKKAVTQGVEDAVKAAGFTVKRLEGDNRYKTNIEILEEAGVEGGEILVATGKDFADSLSASATGKPILLVREKMYDEQINYLKGLKGAKFYIPGGQNAIDDAIVEKIAPYGTIVERLAGSGRRATAVAVAERFFEEPTMAVAAFSDKHADGLCGGPLAATLKAPIFLAKANKTSEAAEYLEKKGIETGYVLGGETVMPNETVVSVFGLKDVSEVVLPTAK